ncbi:glycosyltransferase family protein [Rubritalea tangerina]
MLAQDERYFYVSTQPCGKRLFEDVIGRTLVEGSSHFYIPAATSLHAESLDVDKNLSFIASNHCQKDFIENELFYEQIGCDVYSLVKGNYFISLEELRSQIEYEVSDENLNALLGYAKGYYAGIVRMDALNALSDLGLAIYGVRWRGRSTYFNPDVSRCYRGKPISTEEDNAWVYNTSKIAVNISHPQAITTFSWRVMDIMASNACLLMEKKDDWLDLFGSYLSDEVKSAIIYDDQYDMRQKAKALLSNEELRLRCVRECQHAIAQNGRWPHRFNELGVFFNLSLCNEGRGEGKYVQFIGEEKKLVEDMVRGIEDCNRLNFLSSLRLRMRLKCASYSFLMMMAQIPVLDSLLQAKKWRGRMVGKMLKYAKE